MIHAAWDAGQLDRAAAQAVRLYGREVLGFLRANHAHHDEADDAFAQLSETLWRTLGTFQWKCSLRTWMYLLARRASADVRRGRLRARQALAATEVPDLVARARTETQSLFRTEKRSAFAALCGQLADSDRELLLLRGARELSWREIAMIFADDAAEDRDLEREAARLRKRFQLVRDRLRERGREHGLLP